MKLSRINAILLFILSAAILISCSFERRLAQDYIRYYEGEHSVLLFFPNSIIKTNLKPEQYRITDSLGYYRLDSLSPARSLFLDSINDSLFMKKAKDVMIQELNRYGFKVYEADNIDQFMALKDSSYVLNLEQFEIEEYVYVGYLHEFVEVYDDSSKVYLNALNVNAWFELDRNNVPDEQYPVLYASYYMLDEVKDSRPNIRSSEEELKYEQDTLKMDEVYELAEIVGKKYAINFFDYVLNLYIQDHLPAGRIPKSYFHYHYKGRSLQTFYDDGFIEMDP